MYLTLSNFRSHSHSRYEIQDGSLILLSGRSGCGKTTIFQAIYWCLYGSLRDVYPNKAKNMAPCVTMEIGPYTITRRKKPESLQVSWSDGMYEGTEAQSIIDEIFGNKDLWLTTSYLQQSDRCKLLSGSNSDRLDVLNRLSFCSSDPDEVLEKVQQELGKLSQDLTLKSDRFSHKITAFTQQLHEHPVNPDYASSVEQLQQYRQYLQELQTTRQDLEKKVQHHRSQQALHDMVQKNINQVTNQLSTIDPDANEDILQQLQRQITDLQHYQQKHCKYIQEKRQLDFIQEKISQFPPILQQHLQQHLNITEEEIWKVQNQEQLYATNLRIAKQLGINYNQEDIDRRKLDLDTQIQHLYQQKHKVYLESQQQQLQQQLDRVQITIQETQNTLFDIQQTIGGIDIAKIKEEIRDLEQSLSNLECPHCHQQVRFIQGALQAISDLSVDKRCVHERLQQLQQQQLLSQQMQNRKLQLEHKLSVDNNQQQQLRKQFMSVSEQLSGYSETTSMTESQIQIKIQEMNSILSQLHRIQVVEQPSIVSKDLDQQYQYQQLQKQLQSLNLDDQWKEDQSSELSRIQQRYSQLQPMLFRSTELHKQLANFQQQLRSIVLCPEVEQQLQTTLQEIENTQQFIIESEYTNKMLIQHQQLQDEQVEVQALSQDVEALDDIRKTSIHVECQLLESTVEAINTTMATVLETMFDDPITAKLSLFRTLKTKSRTKPQVNLSISFRGGDYDNINQLSGGEGDRISLALTIALNLISPSPLLLLDECLSSLDGHYRESCIRALRLLIAQGKTILCINHEDVEGFYDSTITDFPFC